MEELNPGQEGTCWCCGEAVAAELCQDCETVRAEVWAHVAEEGAA